jgi:hypothetical protein
VQNAHPGCRPTKRRRRERLGEEGIFLVVQSVSFDLGEGERVAVLDYTLEEAGDWEQTYLNRGLQHMRMWR